METVSLTPEGKIVLTLKHGKHTYEELRFETGLSDRWLSIKLRELGSRGIIRKIGKWYSLEGNPDASSFELSLYMVFQAKRMAEKLRKFSSVRMIVLFGSAAQKKAGDLSDLDMMIVVSKPLEKAKARIMVEISKLEMKHHITVEPLIFTEQDFLDNVYSQEGGIIYGVAEGFEILVDKTGRLSRILRERVEEIRRSHEYLKEAGIWLKPK